ncbi:hypothetical protein BSU04_23225 [Caballeronia sordidicola]|uniref:Uncharacterized protein n=1 Tax=Caballeronia sordidicola TaxID=196367 RepID=A0A226WY83_CABSO|nr:hypothetical protein BSU04_23225 [Caballeronia sordidicola]
MRAVQAASTYFQLDDSSLYREAEAFQRSPEQAKYSSFPRQIKTMPMQGF